LPDPRVDRTKLYPLLEIILWVVSATVSGFDGWTSIKRFGDEKLDWLRQFLPYEQGIPVDDTIARVMRKLDTQMFKTCFAQWMKSVSQAPDGDVVAIDGKQLRRSYNDSAGTTAIHRVSTWSCANSVVLGQAKTADKSNEITAIPQLLDVLALKNCVVTIDAMGCQKSIAEKIIGYKETMY
jgi:predicted transposase YbfD/YdcC